MSESCAFPRAFVAQRLFAEWLGTALLLAMVVGSGIMAEQLAQANTAIALLANTVATGAGLVALILRVRIATLLAREGWSAERGV